jgi:ferredoxin
MILTKPKSWQDIKEALDLWDLKKVIVVGCGSCSAQCGTGGTEGVKKIVANLENSPTEVISTIVIEEPCDARLVKNELRRIKEDVEKADGFIVASCGMGAQVVSEISNKPIVITTDTIMMSQTERIGVYHDKCRACATCHLNETGGICPITACAKSLLNGPCGGVIEGKCEVPAHKGAAPYTVPCGWVRIYTQLKKLGHLELFEKIREPRDWSLVQERRDINYRKEMKDYYACNSD